MCLAGANMGLNGIIRFKKVNVGRIPYNWLPWQMAAASRKRMNTNISLK